MLDIKDARDNRLYRVLNSSAIEQHKTLESPSKTSSTIVFIDSGVDDYQSLVDGALPEAEVIVLDSAQDGVEQITKVLQGRTEIAAIHLVSHGSPGCLYLGNSQLSLDTLNHYAAQIKNWVPSTSVTQEGKCASIPILLYGCNVAAGDAGEEFVMRLGQLTGANIAASAKRTGSAALGGDWELEVKTGSIETPLVFQKQVQKTYVSVLAIITNSGFGEGSKKTITLGSNGGETVRFSFDPREFLNDADGTPMFPTKIPDKFVIRYEGKNIVDTEFIEDPLSRPVFIEPGNDNKIEVIVETNNPDSFWQYEIITESFVPDTTPLNIEVANGEFADTDWDGRADAQGTIFIGRKDGISRLLRVENALATLEDKDGNGEADTLRITDGTVFSEIGNVTDPLFIGDFEIPFKTARTSSLNDDVGPENELKLAGLDIDYKGFKLDPDKILLEGGFVFPIIPGGLEVDLNAPNTVVVDTNGITTGGFKLPISEGIKVLDLFKTKGVSDLSVEYRKVDDLFKIQGKISAQPFFKVLEDNKSDFVIDFAKDNYIQIQNGVADVKGAFSLKNVSLPLNFKISELAVNLKTEKGELKEIGGKGQFKFPFPSLPIDGGGLELGFRRNPFEVNKIGANVTGLNIPIGNSGAFLQQLGLTFDKIAPSDPGFEVGGPVGLTYGPKVEGKELVTIDTSVKFSKDKFTGKLEKI